MGGETKEREKRKKKKTHSDVPPLRQSSAGSITQTGAGRDGKSSQIQDANDAVLLAGGPAAGQRQALDGVGDDDAAVRVADEDDVALAGGVQLAQDLCARGGGIFNHADLGIRGADGGQGDGAAGQAERAELRADQVEGPGPVPGARGEHDGGARRGRDGGRGGHGGCGGGEEEPGEMHSQKRGPRSRLDHRAGAASYTNLPELYCKDWSRSKLSVGTNQSLVDVLQAGVSLEGGFVYLE